MVPRSGGSNISPRAIANAKRQQLSTTHHRFPLGSARPSAADRASPNSDCGRRCNRPRNWDGRLHHEPAIAPRRRQRITLDHQHCARHHHHPARPATRQRPTGHPRIRRRYAFRGCVARKTCGRPQHRPRPHRFGSFGCRCCDGEP